MVFQQVKMSLLISWIVFQQVKRLAAVVLNCNKFNKLIYFLIDWFHLIQVKSTNWFGNQPVEFRNSLTISAVIFERELFWSFFSAKLFWKRVETLSFIIIQTAAVEDWSWINSWRFWLVFEAWIKWFVVGWVVLPFRFDLSQALCVCLVVF